MNWAAIPITAVFLSLDRRPFSFYTAAALFLLYGSPPPSLAFTERNSVRPGFYGRDSNAVILYNAVIHYNTVIHYNQEFPKLE